MRQQPCRQAAGNPGGSARRAQYRLVTTLLDPRFVVSRTADKLLNSVIQVSLYWGVGASLRADNLTNVIALVYMWAVFPGLVTITYMPAILAERRLFIRCAAQGRSHSARAELMPAKLTARMRLRAASAATATTAPSHTCAPKSRWSCSWLCRSQLSRPRSSSI